MNKTFYSDFKGGILTLACFVTEDSFPLSPNTCENFSLMIPSSPTLALQENMADKAKSHLITNNYNKLYVTLASAGQLDAFP